jgi:cytochrome c
MKYCANNLKFFLPIWSNKTMNVKSIYLLFLFTLSAAFTSVQADEGEQLYQAKGCATCHGPAGVSLAPIWPSIAGQHKQYLVAQMKDIKSGKRNNGMSVTMKPLVANVSDEEMEKIADWLSKLK